MAIVGLAGIKPGDLFTTDGRDAWRVESMCEQPTMTLVNLDTGEKRGGAVGCPNLGPFVPLVPQFAGTLPRPAGVRLRDEYPDLDSSCGGIEG